MLESRPRLVKIVVEGFKSYSTRTEIHFDTVRWTYVRITPYSLEETELANRIFSMLFSSYWGAMIQINELKASKVSSQEKPRELW